MAEKKISMKDFQHKMKELQRDTIELVKNIEGVFPSEILESEKDGNRFLNNSKTYYIMGMLGSISSLISEVNKFVDGMIKKPVLESDLNGRPKGH